MQQNVVVITGGSSGIGRAAATLFAKQGWRVGLIGRERRTLEQAQLQAGGAAIAAADVADSGQLERAAARLEAALGPIDVWVNNAGVGIFGEFLDVPERDFRRVTEVNYLGAVNGTRVALRRMQRRKRGVIVQVGSALSDRGVPPQAAYSGSKFALRGFTEALQAELDHAGSRVRLSLVAPPATSTPFYNHARSYVSKPVRPPPPVIAPETVAEAIYLAATSKREVQVGEPTVAPAAGNKLLPSVLDFFAGAIGVPLQFADLAGGAVERAPNWDRPRVSRQFWLSRHRGAIGALVAAGAAGWLAWRQRRA